VSRREISPALAGSVALHLAVAAALLISWPFPRDLKIGSAVPVTLVAAPPAEMSAEVTAPAFEAAQTEQPVAEAPPEPTPPTAQPQPQPQPQPTPTPPQPTPKPAPTPPKAAPPAPAKPAPATKPAAKPEKSLDLDALAASVSKLTKAGPAKPSSAAQGAARPQAAPQVGQSVSAAGQATLNGLIAELERRWNPNCEVEGGRDVQVRVAFNVGPAGQLVGEPSAQIRSAATPAARIGQERALRAVYAAAPFRSLSRELYGQKIGVTFDARKACS
jgi:protein TonB